MLRIVPVGRYPKKRGSDLLDQDSRLDPSDEELLWCSTHELAYWQHVGCDACRDDSADRAYDSKKERDHAR